MAKSKAKQSPTLRDKRQQEFADAWLTKGKYGILYLCPRFGKIYTTINILEKLDKNISVLIAYPDLKIKEAWETDFKTRKYKNPNITYTTHMSLKKHVDEKFDLIVLDEIHLLSDAQLDAAEFLIEKANCDVLGLTGTMTDDTKIELKERLNMPILAKYTIEQAIAEGVITDYEILVRLIPLDKKIVQDFKGKKRTEKAQFEALSWVINKKQGQNQDVMFLRFARMRIIQNSLAKKEATKRILQNFKDERILVFCGVTAVADELGIPVYHSKKGEKETFEAFANGEGNHLAVVKIGNTGVTYKPLNKVIINYFDSNAENLAQKINRCMAMEYDNPDKKAKIYILCSTEEVEQKWLKKALEFFDKSKIKYV
jgi:superfamily II DNA or RNA helicase